MKNIISSLGINQKLFLLHATLSGISLLAVSVVHLIIFIDVLTFDHLLIMALAVFLLIMASLVLFSKLRGVIFSINNEMQRDDDNDENSNKHYQAKIAKLSTELKELRSRADSASLTKSEFVANISHEFRTPMNGILGMARLALKADIPDKQVEQLKAIVDCGESLLLIINDLLDFSKIEAGKLVLDPKQFSVRRCLRNLFKVLETKVIKTGLKLEYFIDENVPDLLIGDEGRIKQVVSNVIANSIKFTKKGGILVNVRKSSSEKANSIRLHIGVADSGIGIPSSKLESIFEAFTQADGSMTRKHEGAGLGLTISRQITELMQGSIKAVSPCPKNLMKWREGNVGTVVYVDFKLQIGVERRSESRRIRGKNDFENVKAVKALDLLLAEDNVVNQKLAVGFLTNRGHNVRVVSNGREVVCEYERRKYDAILMDIQMPEMDGVEATKEIRLRESNSNSARTPIIAMTAHNMKGDRERFLASGMDAFIAKPIRLQALIEVVENCVQ